jgi:hypothetical protein
MPPLRFHTLWAINGPLEIGRLQAQLDGFHETGFDGVVFHPRFYPGQPAYLSPDYFVYVSAAILHAKSLGLSFWIYDEDGWPSGTVGGQLLRQHPEVAQRRAGLFRIRPERLLTEFDHDGVHWYVGEKLGSGVDYLNPALASHFLALTHDQYRTHLSGEAFDYLEAFFCDEPEFGLGHAHDSLPGDGAIPWTSGLAELYMQRYGEELVPKMRDLFFTTERSSGVRVRLWELLRDRFCSAFLDPINAWCRKYGKQFTAHIKGEEHPLFQVPMVGSCSTVFRHLGLPGIDALERKPANDFFPRQLASSARQFGEGRCMAEAFGGAGWGAMPRDLERYLLWLGRNGVTDFGLHLSQYRLNSVAIRDWPPSQPFHLSWMEAYAGVLRQVRSQLESAPRSVSDTLVISPHREIMAAYEPRELLQMNIHNAVTYPDSAAGRINREFMTLIDRLGVAGVNYDVTDEHTWERLGARHGDELRLGRAIYRRLIRHEDDWSSPEPAVSVTDNSLHRTGEIIPIKWSLISPPKNSWLLEAEPLAETAFSCRFECVDSLSTATVEAFFADDVIAAELDGQQLNVRQLADGCGAPLPRLTIGMHELKIEFSGVVTAPFIWLKGAFVVLSRSNYTSGPGQTIKTSSPFFMADCKSDSVDGVPGGYPFLAKQIKAAAAFEISRPGSGIELGGVAAAAGQVTLDGKKLDWLWGPVWRVNVSLAPGVHTLELALVPSSYNHYGPHHYFAGDASIISSDQFSGRRNFADAPGAPADTRIPDWHFVPFEFPDKLLIPLHL